ncbi:MAG TPA: hypothetical protein DF383_02845 [Deltaproteobacteria bacterium]|nr:hypothetical protein [Deltaproteobacteria bacterium]
MRSKILFLPLAFLALTLIGACGKKLPSEQVLESVVGAMCKKLVTCQPSAMPNEEFCQSAMKVALEKGKKLPKVSATQEQLDTCLKGIADAECGNLLGKEPPKGCGFLK